MKHGLLKATVVGLSLFAMACSSGGGDDSCSPNSTFDINYTAEMSGFNSAFDSTYMFNSVRAEETSVEITLNNGERIQAYADSEIQVNDIFISTLSSSISYDLGEGTESLQYTTGVNRFSPRYLSSSANNTYFYTDITADSQSEFEQVKNSVNSDEVEICSVAKSTITTMVDESSPDAAEVRLEITLKARINEDAI